MICFVRDKKNLSYVSQHFIFMCILCFYLFFGLLRFLYVCYYIGNFLGSISECLNVNRALKSLVSPTVQSKALASRVHLTAHCRDGCVLQRESVKHVSNMNFLSRLLDVLEKENKFIWLLDYLILWRFPQENVSQFLDTEVWSGEVCAGPRNSGPQAGFCRLMPGLTWCSLCVSDG